MKRSIMAGFAGLALCAGMVTAGLAQTGETAPREIVAPTTMTTAPMSKSEIKAQRKQQKREEKASRDAASAAKQNSKAKQANDKAEQSNEKAGYTTTPADPDGQAATAAH